MSQLEVDKIIPQSGTTLTIGDSGDTITFGTGTTPQLGGNLDLNSNDITGTGNIDITGTVTSDELNVDGTGTLSTIGNGTQQIRTYVDADEVSLLTEGSARLDLWTGGNRTIRLDANGDISFYEDTGTTPKLFWDASAENLGLGNTSPNGRIETTMVGSFSLGYLDYTADALFIQSNGTAVNNTYGAGISFSRIGGLNRVAGISSVQTDNDPDRAGLAFFVHGSAAAATDMSEAVRINHEGNVGIGTSSPSRLLTVSPSTGSAQIGLVSQDSSISEVLFGDASDDNVGRVYYDHSSNFMAMFTNASEAMRIDSSGNVGIGVTGGFLGSGSLAMERDKAIRWQDDSDGTLYADIYGSLSGELILRTGSSLSERMRIDSSGNVLIGRTSQVSNGTFVVEGVGNVLELYRPTTSATANIFVGYSNIGGTETATSVIEANGDFESATNSYGATSDINLKQQITNASSQWEDIKALQIKNYKFNNLVEQFGDEAPRHLGVIAQDLEASGMNGLVDVNESGTKSVKYSILYMKAVKALQEAMQKIEDLEARVNTLEGN